MFKGAFLVLAAAACMGVELTVPKGAAPIADSYIVTVRANATDAAHAALAAKLGGRKVHIHSFRAVTAGFDAETLQWVLQHELVEAVEQDSVVKAFQASCGDYTNQVSWGQSRLVSQTVPNPPNWYHNRNWGNGVEAYVLDTGILCSHNELAGRCKNGQNFAGGANTDNNGHGTHCAGTIGGTHYGISPSTHLTAVKVLSDSGSGSVAGIVNGVDWAVSDKNSHGRPGIISMSLGGGASAAMDTAVNSAVSAGVHVTLASGNENQNACNVSPARTGGRPDGPITVSSSDRSNGGDIKSSFSNWGTCVDIWAPGSNIIAAYIGSNSATRSLSGTSMACPHVAGALAAAFTDGTVMTPPAAKVYLTTTTGQKDAFPQNSIGTGSPNVMTQVPCN